MKTMIMLALIGLIPLSSQAQNTKKCTCKHKTMHHKVAAVHHKTPEKAPLAPILPTATVYRVETKPAEQPCFTYKKNNIVVTQCPDLMFDNDGYMMQYSTEGTYMGYYPAMPKPMQPAAEDTPNTNATGKFAAPQHTTIDNYKGPAPADGSNCTSNCTPQ